MTNHPRALLLSALGVVLLATGCSNTDAGRLFYGDEITKEVNASPTLPPSPSAITDLPVLSTLPILNGPYKVSIIQDTKEGTVTVSGFMDYSNSECSSDFAVKQSLNSGSRKARLYVVKPTGQTAYMKSGKNGEWVDSRSFDAPILPLNLPFTRMRSGNPEDLSLCGLGALGSLLTQGGDGTYSWNEDAVDAYASIATTSWVMNQLDSAGYPDSMKSQVATAFTNVERGKGTDAIPLPTPITVVSSPARISYSFGSQGDSIVIFLEPVPSHAVQLTAIPSVPSRTPPTDPGSLADLVGMNTVNGYDLTSPATLNGVEVPSAPPVPPTPTPLPSAQPQPSDTPTAPDDYTDFTFTNEPSPTA